MMMFQQWIHMIVMTIQSILSSDENSDFSEFFFPIGSQLQNNIPVRWPIYSKHEFQIKNSKDMILAL